MHRKLLKIENATSTTFKKFACKEKVNTSLAGEQEKKIPQDPLKFTKYTFRSMNNTKTPTNPAKKPVRNGS